MLSNMPTSDPSIEEGFFSRVASFTTILRLVLEIGEPDDGMTEAASAVSAGGGVVTTARGAEASSGGKQDMGCTVIIHYNRSKSDYGLFVTYKLQREEKGMNTNHLEAGQGYLILCLAEEEQEQEQQQQVELCWVSSS